MREVDVQEEHATLVGGPWCAMDTFRAARQTCRVTHGARLAGSDSQAAAAHARQQQRRGTWQRAAQQRALWPRCGRGLWCYTPRTTPTGAPEGPMMVDTHS
jgi:hypothetical protein